MSSDRADRIAPFSEEQQEQIYDIYLKDPLVGCGHLIIGSVCETFDRCAKGGGGAFYNSSTAAVINSNPATANMSVYMCGGRGRDDLYQTAKYFSDRERALGAVCASFNAAAGLKTAWWWMPVVASIALAGVL